LGQHVGGGPPRQWDSVTHPPTVRDTTRAVSVDRGMPGEVTDERGPGRPAGRRRR